ncbi:MAG: transposase [Elusimicrobia bacterium]|nr:transposase [Elusimicrobiota bacterium]
MKTEFRKNTRLKNYDYAANGYYFVTVVTRNRQPFLCSGGYKPAIEECVKRLPEFISGLSIDWFVVMDNHVHIIFVFEGCARPLGRVVAAMKSAITKIVLSSGGRESAPEEGDLHRPLQLWEWNYYEHVIRNEKALSKIREYIQNNPEAEKLNWDELDV